MSSTSSLDRLPLELLQKICSFLEGPDLHAASYSSKAWRQGTIHLLFSGVVIPVTNDRPKLSHVGSSPKASQTFYASMLKHIRRLTIRDITDAGWVRRKALLNGQSLGSRHDLGDYCVGWEATPKQIAKRYNKELKRAREAAWRPLAAFIRVLPALNSLIYACASQPPTCLLDVLEKSQPSCGLYFYTFPFRSLVHCPPECDEVDPYELRLAKLPNLRSINVFSHYTGYNALFDHKLDEIEDLLLGLIRPPWRGNGNSQYLEETTTVFDVLPQRCAVRQQRTDPATAKKSRPSITSFAAYACGTGNFTTSFGGYVDWVDSLVKAFLHDDPLVNLTRLNIRVYARVYHPVGQFLARLLPLRDLEIHGDISSDILDTILAKHGPSVRRLILPWLNDTGDQGEYAFSVPLIKRVHDSCPQLDELGLTIARSLGDQRELATYQALGAFRSLKRLALNLDCAVLPTSSSLGSKRETIILVQANILGPGHPHRNSANIHVGILPGEMRALLLNCAIDARLANAIYRSIAKYTPKWFFPPERLEIRAVRSGLLSKRADILPLHQVAVELRRSWRCSLNFDCFAKPRVEEIDEQERENLERIYDHHGGITVCPEIMRVIQRLWPGKNKDWRKNWHSRQLETESVV